MSKQTKEVLVIGSKRQSVIGQSLEFLEGQGYNFHFIIPDYPNTTAKLKQRLFCDDDISFDVGAFINDAVEYVRVHKIDGVIAFGDMDMLLVAAVCERCGLPGPTPEAAFLTLHKYYCRVAENSQIWFEGIDLFDDNSWRSKVRYPCFVKPTCLQAGIGGRKVYNEEEMEDILMMQREMLRPYFDLTRMIFEAVVDKSKYPLADRIMVIAEELVDGDGVGHHCVEGWVDGEGHCNIDIVHDVEQPLPGLSVFQSEIFPSSIGLLDLRHTERQMRKLVENIGLRSCLFYGEVFLRTINGSLRVDTVEINDRIGFNHESMHMTVSGASPLHTAVYIACGEYDKALDECTTMVAGLKETHCNLVSMWTTRSGKMSDLLDFDMVEYYTRNPDAGVFGLNGKPGVLLEFPKNEQLSAVDEGIRLGQFTIIGTDPEELKTRAREIRKKLVKD